MKKYKDRLIRVNIENEVIGLFITSRDATETARRFHGSSPIATAALGRLLSATAMMGNLLKNEDDKITVQITGDGPMGGLLVTGDTKGRIKGYVNNPYVILPPKENGHLDVGGAVGAGTLSVIKDLGLKDTYNGFVPLVSGEIGEDLTEYFLSSEQIPSSVGVGVLMNKDSMEVDCAGGFIIQVMPNAKDEIISALERNLSEFGSVTERLSEDNSPEYLLSKICNGLSYEITDELPVEFYCDCSRDRVRRALKLLGDVELVSLIKENKPVEMKCQFCNSVYVFSVEEIKNILNEKV